MDVRMFRFSEEKRNLIAFVSLTKERHVVCSNALVLLPGLDEGVLSMSYSQRLADELLKIDFSLVQVNLSSSFHQFGFNDLKSDCSELSQLFKTIKEKFHFKKMVFLGHSTGAQGALYFLRHSEASSLVDAVILHGAVSDRDAFPSVENAAPIVEEAKKLREEGRENEILTNRLFDVPVTASRILSLTERLSDDDMFSVDLSKEELEPILSPVQVPISLCFCADDEFVLDKDAQKGLAQRMVAILEKSSPKVDCKYFPGNHGLTAEEHYIPFVEYVCDFVHSVARK